jgi:hypothetical protein
MTSCLAALAVTFGFVCSFFVRSQWLYLLIDRTRVNLISLLTLGSISATVCIDSKAGRAYFMDQLPGFFEPLWVKQPVTVTMLLGSANGFHQRYVSQRTGTITDVGFDLCGGSFTLMLFSQFSRSQRTHDCDNLSETLDTAAGLSLIRRHVGGSVEAATTHPHYM